LKEDAVLIFALPRTGSTNLMRALNCHPALRICNEPFNGDSGSIEGLGPVNGAAALDAGLERMAAWVKQHGARSSREFEGVEVMKNFPKAWLPAAKAQPELVKG